MEQNGVRMVLSRMESHMKTITICLPSHCQAELSNTPLRALHETLETPFKRTSKSKIPRFGGRLGRLHDRFFRHQTLSSRPHKGCAGISAEVTYLTATTDRLRLVNGGVYEHFELPPQNRRQESSCVRFLRSHVVQGYLGGSVNEMVYGIIARFLGKTQSHVCLPEKPCKRCETRSPMRKRK